MKKTSYCPYRSHCSWKTRLSISLAKAIGGEIISADSMQVYKYMDIGSAKIMPEEMQGVPITWWMS